MALKTSIDPEPEASAAALMGPGLFGLCIAGERTLCRDRLSASESIWHAAGNPSRLARARLQKPLRCFHQMERELDGELGVDPELATLRLAEQIRSGQIL